MVTDCDRAAIFAISNVTTAGGFDNIVHDTGTGTPSNYTTALGDIFTNAEIYRVERSALFVAPST